jgi:hypothetical protein
VKHKKHTKEVYRVNQVQIEFTNKPLTAWGGICTLVAKFLGQIAFREWVEANISIKETSPNAGGIYGKVLAQFLTCLTGGTRFSHLQWWGHGLDAVKSCFGVEWLPKAGSVLTRCFGKIKNQAASERIRSAGCELTRSLLKQEQIGAEDLYLDSSVLIRYGSQEGAKRGYNPKKHGRSSHHPVKASLSCGYVVNLWNRSGDVNSSHRCVEFYEQTLKELPAGMQIRRTVADSGLYNVDFIEYLEGNGRYYIIAVPISRIIQKEILAIRTWEQVADGIEVAEFQFQHVDKKWKKLRRYVVVRQYIPRRPQAAGKQPFLFKELEEHKEYRYSVMITNEVDLAAVEVWRSYRPRAKEENVIKDLKEGYGWDAFNLHGFWATEAVMILVGMVFHNLILYLNRNILNRQGVLPQLKTMRLKYFAWPALLGKSGGTPTLRLGIRDRSLRGQVRYWLGKIAEIPLRLNCIAIDNLATVPP